MASTYTHTYHMPESRVESAGSKAVVEPSSTSTRLEVVDKLGVGGMATSLASFLARYNDSRAYL